MTSLDILRALFAPPPACGALCRSVAAEVEAMARADALDARARKTENAPR